MFVCSQCAAHFAEDGYCAHDGKKLVPASSDVLVGQTVGRYRIEAPIGIGGMGKVYLAVQPEIGSRVAIKVLADNIANSEEHVDRFFAEARAVNLIRHENIVNVLDLGRLPHGPPYIVMEYLDGQPLSRLLAETGALEQWLAIRLSLEVLSALGAAHASNIVHRDLKPDNIFMSPNGHAKVLDFGIAKLATEGETAQVVTRSGAILGTPHYMSPEQARSGPVDGRSDIYSMGVILYECVTGRRPFQADSLFDLLRMHIEAQPDRPSQIRRDLEPRVEAAILRALAKDPAHRFQSAEAFSAALEEVASSVGGSQWGSRSGLAHAPTMSPQARHSAPTAAQKPPGRAGRSAWVAGIVAVPLIGGAVALAITAGDDASGGSDAGAAVGGLVRVVGEKADDAAAPAAAADAGARFAEAPEETAPASVGAGPTVKKEATSTPAAGGDDDARKDVDGQVADSGAEAEPAQGKDAEPYAPRTVRTFNPEAFDISGFIPKAHKMAREAFPDAVLVRIDAEGVRPNGKAELTMSEDFSVLYRFMSPKNAKRPADLPIGAPFEPNCLFYVNVDARSISAYVLEGWKCDNLEKISPKCTVKEVWERGIERGAPAENAVGNVGIWTSYSGHTRWNLDVGDVFDEWIEDGC